MRDLVIRCWPRPAETAYSLNELEAAVDHVRDLMMQGLRTPVGAYRPDRFTLSLRGAGPDSRTTLVEVQLMGNRFPSAATEREREPAK